MSIEIYDDGSVEFVNTLRLLLNLGFNTRVTYRNNFTFLYAPKNGRFTCRGQNQKGDINVWNYSISDLDDNVFTALSNSLIRSWRSTASRTSVI